MASAVDPSQELLQRYNAERDKRFNKTGPSQYIDARAKDLQYLANDPWVNYDDPRVKNAPLKDGSNIKFLVSGAGHNGLLFACRLVEVGFSSKDIVCVDIAGGFGGTWYWNRYPGLMCDIEGYIYLPLLEETGYVPKHRYSFGDEIRGQNERAAKQYGIQGQFCTKVESQIWDEDKNHWVVKMTRKLNENETESITVFADFVVVAGGVLNIPKIPKLPGWEALRSKKHVIHASRWDYKYTGGTQEQPDLVNLKDKTIAIIGTGATAVQIVPELAKWAKHVYVVQRTPPYNGYRGNRLTDKEEFKALSKEKGWQEHRRRNFNAWISDSPTTEVNLVDDGWTHTPGATGLLGSTRRIVGPNDVEEHIKYLHDLDRPRADALRKRVDDIVKDKNTAEKLKAYYGNWCKRPTFHDDYLPAFNQSNVTLLDTDGKGLDAFSETGLVLGGKTYEIDALVLATGFTIFDNGDPSAKLNAVIKGRNGKSLSDKLLSGGNAPLFGMAVSDFPNMFGYFTSGTSISWNLTSVYDVLARYAAHVVKRAHVENSGQRVVVDVDPKFEGFWGDEIAKRSAWYSALLTCTPGYITNEGKAVTDAKNQSAEEASKKARQAGWASGPVDFQDRLEAYAAQPDLVGFKATAVV